jgi:signal transduction histidine kinase
MLRDFILANREEILLRARSRIVARNAPVATEEELTEGLPVFLDQLRESLRTPLPHPPDENGEIAHSAGQRGDHLFHQGLTVAQVVHDYGDLYQVISELGVEQHASIAVDELQTLSLCLDDAIAGAVTAFLGEHEREGTERLGMFAHEMRNLLTVAMLSFASIKRGVVGAGGSTSAILEQTLTQLHTLVARSLAEVRIDAGMQSMERVPLYAVIEEAETSAALIAQASGVRFSVAPVDRSVFVEIDRQSLAAAITNLVQNGLKFTRPGTTVHLRVVATATRVLIEVEDECGGLPAEKRETLLQPFVQGGVDRTGMGLGLSICAKTVKAVAGELHVRDLPGRGCVFTIDLPKHLPPLHVHQVALRPDAPGRR